MKAVIIGVGLIGGSFAKSIRAQHPGAEIYALDQNTDHIKEATEMGLIDREATKEDLQDADLVVVAIPVDVIVEKLPEVLDAVKDSCLVIDAGSTKKRICQAIETHPKRRNFLASHPIAGTEFSGPRAALDELFMGKTNILCEIEKTANELQESGLNLFKNMGMHLRYMNPEDHDRHIAYVSHLSHISSFMLGKTVIEKEKNENDIFDMAGSGFESTVRLAKSSPAMWQPIFAQNKENVLEALNEYIANLMAFREKLQNEDNKGVFKEMENTNRIKEILKGIPANKT